MESKKTPTHTIYEKPFENTGLYMIRIEGQFSNLKMSTVVNRIKNIEKTMKTHSNMSEFEVI